MKQKQLITEKINATENLKDLCHVYEELSVIKMQEVKAGILSSSDYFEELSSVYTRVKASYIDKVTSLLKKKGVKDAKKMLIFQKNQKQVDILITANSSLYGKILRATCELFIENASRSASDLVVTGELGRELIKSISPQTKFQYFFIPDSHLENFNFDEILNYLLQYEKINVFHGFYQTLFKQNPVLSNITGDSPSPTSPAIASATAGPKFLFEPSLETILMFFEKNIIKSLFSQAVFDSYLSRLASRVSSMEDAIDKIENEENLLNAEKRKIFAYDENRKQAERLAGMSLWS